MASALEIIGTLVGLLGAFAALMLVAGLADVRDARRRAGAKRKGSR